MNTFCINILESNFQETTLFMKKYVTMLYCNKLSLYIFILSCNFVVKARSIYCDAETPKWPDYHHDEKTCPQIGDKFITYKNIPWGEKDRAWHTVPPEIEIKLSIIPGSGSGTFTTTFISQYTWLAEYEGEILRTQDDDYISDYAWIAYKADNATHYIDAGHVDTSNWVRWVNCARNPSELSVTAVHCRGKVFYITNRDIYPGQELLVYYGDDYAKLLNIDHSSFI